MSNYQMSILGQGGQRIVDFSNNTGGFVEVVLEIDGKQVKGYCYPPFHHKPIRRMRSGEALPFSRYGKLRAFIYHGIGKYKDDQDYDTPPFIRRKLNDFKFLNTDQLIQERKRKVTFRRTGSQPVEVLEIPY